MNKERRLALKKALKLVAQAKDVVEIACDEESDCMDNLPDNLQGGSLYEKMEEAVGNLESALVALEDADESIRLAI